MSSETTTPGTPAPPRAARATAGGRLPRLAGGARRYGFALAALAAVAIGMAAMWAAGALKHGHEEHTGPVALRTSAPVGDLSMAVMGVQRLRDGHAGVNSPRLPMNGPAMPMSSMGPIGGALTDTQEQVAVTVTLRNPSGDPVAYDAGRLLLVQDGREVPLLKRTRSTLGAGTLMPGSQISGSIYYVVKRGTAPLQLRDTQSETLFVIDRRRAVSGAKPSSGDGHDHEH